MSLPFVAVVVAALFAGSALPVPSGGPSLTEPALGEPAADGEALARFREVLDDVRKRAGLDDEPQGTPAGLRNLEHLLDFQSSQNQTALGKNHSGAHTHHHGAVGEEGLQPVWATAFHGVPNDLIVADVNGDGIGDPIVSSEAGVVALDGTTGAMLWARHIGSYVSSVFVTRGGPDQVQVGYATYWGGQSARIEIVDGLTGESEWQFIHTASILRAGTVSDEPNADVVALDVLGVSLRVARGDSKVLWKTDNRLAPNAIVYGNLGSYLAVIADLNGDGVRDITSASLHYYSAPLVTYTFFTMLHALDGKTGARLWTYVLGGDPAFISDTILTDLDSLDARGDKSLDISYTGLSLRWYDVILAPTPGLLLWDSFFEVLDGSSSHVGVLASTRHLPTPELPLEYIQALDHVDKNRDGADELVIVRTFIVDSLLTGQRQALERYTLFPSLVKDPAGAVVSDWKIGSTDPFTLGLWGGDFDGDGARDLAWSSASSRDGNLTLLRSPDHKPVTVPISGKRILAARFDQERIWFATESDVHASTWSAPGNRTWSYPLRGVPYEVTFGRVDTDPVDDAVVVSTDGSLYVVDGVSGDVVRTIDHSTDLHSVRVADVNGDRVTDFLVVDVTGNAWAIDGRTETTLWSTKTRAFFSFGLPTWFEGNGDAVPDLLAPFDVFSRTFEATNGKDGLKLWSSVVNFSYYGGGPTTVRMRATNLDDLVFVSPYYPTFALDGTTGKVLWSRPRDISYPICAGGADTGGDGRQETFVLLQRAAKVNVEIYGQDGKIDNADGLLDGTLVSCSVTPVPRSPRGEDLLIRGLFRGTDGGSAGFGRLGADGAWVWQAFDHTDPVAFSSIPLLGIDAAGRSRPWFYYGWQDHVFARNLTHGEVEAQFTINGPFVAGGALADLDGDGASEVFVLSSDGILWALSGSAEDTQKRLQQIAKKLNKRGPMILDESPTPDLGRLRSADKGSTPGVGPALAAITALGVAFALRRHRRG